MRTRITCGWLVAHADGHHTLWRNAELVYEGNTVLFVGERFEGAVDREIDARDKLVAPGFIDTHVHSGHRASHRMISDVGRGDYFGQPFLEISVAREGTRVGGDPHLIENFFCKLKEFKRIALRADKTDQSFEAMIYLAAAIINSR